MRFKTMSATLEYMIKNNLPLNVRTYVDLNWFGSKTVHDLEGEDRIEVDEFREAVRKLRKKN
jgi:hypothetical protein